VSFFKHFLEASQVAMMRQKQKCKRPLSFYPHLHEKDNDTQTI